MTLYVCSACKGVWHAIHSVEAFPPAGDYGGVRRQGAQVPPRAHPRDRVHRGEPGEQEEGFWHTTGLWPACKATATPWFPGQIR